MSQSGDHPHTDPQRRGKWPCRVEQRTRGSTIKKRRVKLGARIKRREKALVPKGGWTQRGGRPKLKKKNQKASNRGPSVGVSERVRSKNMQRKKGPLIAEIPCCKKRGGEKERPRRFRRTREQFCSLFTSAWGCRFVTVGRKKIKGNERQAGE